MKQHPYTFDEVIELESFFKSLMGKFLMTETDITIFKDYFISSRETEITEYGWKFWKKPKQHTEMRFFIDRLVLESVNGESHYHGMPLTTPFGIKGLRRMRERFIDQVELKLNKLGAVIEKENTKLFN